MNRRCKFCDQEVDDVDFFFSYTETRDGIWYMVYFCRKCERVSSFEVKE